MPQRKIKFTKNKYYHIFNIGKGKGNIFLSEGDLQRFVETVFLSNNCSSFRGIAELEKRKSVMRLESIKKILKDNKIAIKPLVKICAFCLMPDHFHFLAREDCPRGIIQFMQKLSNSYGKFFSNKHNRPGSLFKGRYQAVEVKSTEQIRFLIAYINAINPAQLVEPYLKIKGIESYSRVSEAIEMWQWSSHQEFLNRRSLLIVDKKTSKKFFENAAQYNKFVKEILLGKKNKIWDEIQKITFDH